MNNIQLSSPPPWQDSERLPDLSATAAQRLRFYVEHPDAPQFTGRSGHKLSASDLSGLRQDKKRYQGMSELTPICWTG